MKKKFLALLLTLATAFSLAIPASAASADFSDVSTSHWAYSSVKWCADNGIVNGVGNNKFAPDDTLTGAQFSVMLARTFYADEVSAAKSSGDNWYAAEMRVLENNGVYGFVNVLTFEKMTLIEDESVGLSRNQMAVMMSNIISDIVELDINAATAKVSDAMGSPYYGLPIVRCVNAGLLNGYSDGLFHGDDTLTRAQASAVIYRLYNFMNGNNAPAGNDTGAEKNEGAVDTGSVTTSTGIELPENYTELRYSEMSEEQAWEAIRIELTKLIQAHQTANGLDACEEWDVLVTGANARAKELVERFEHVRPDGRPTYTLYQELIGVGANPSENCWTGTTYDMTIADTATAIFNSWKNSSGHNETMLDGFDYIGVGVYRKGKTAYAVTHFVTGVHHDAVVDALAKL